MSLAREALDVVSNRARRTGKRSEPGRRRIIMALTLTDCKATATSITIFFSAPVNQQGIVGNSALSPSNYQVCDPASANFATVTTLAVGVPVQPVGPNAVAISFPSKTFKSGDRVT